MSDLWPNLHKPRTTKIELVPCYEGSGPICSLCEDDEELDMESGSDVVCRRCGTIVDTPLEWTAEYRSFSTEQGPDPSRCGFPVNPLMPESSLGTIIMSRGCGRGSSVSKIMNRLRRYHGWNQMPYRERKLWGIFDGLQIRASNAGVNTAVIEEAKELFAQLTASESCRGQGQRDAMVAACLWESLKRHDTPRLPKDIAEVFMIPLKNVTRGIKKFQQVLALRISSQKTDTYAGVKEEVKEAPILKEATEEEITTRAHVRRAIWQKTVARTTTYEDFIVPFLTNLAVGRTSVLETLVRQVCQRTETHGIVPENTPPSLTASVIAFCCAAKNININIADIASVCGISAVTIQKCLKRLQPWKEKLLEE